MLSDLKMVDLNFDPEGFCTWDYVCVDNLVRLVRSGTHVEGEIVITSEYSG